MTAAFTSTGGGQEGVNPNLSPAKLTLERVRDEASLVLLQLWSHGYSCGRCSSI